MSTENFLPILSIELLNCKFNIFVKFGYSGRSQTLIVNVIIKKSIIFTKPILKSIPNLDHDKVMPNSENANVNFKSQLGKVDMHLAYTKFE